MTPLEEREYKKLIQDYNDLERKLYNILDGKEELEFIYHLLADPRNIPQARARIGNLIRKYSLT